MLTSLWQILERKQHKEKDWLQITASQASASRQLESIALDLRWGRISWWQKCVAWVSKYLMVAGSRMREDTVLWSSLGRHCAIDLLGKTLCYGPPWEDTALWPSLGRHCAMVLLRKTLCCGPPWEDTVLWSSFLILLHSVCVSPPMVGPLFSESFWKCPHRHTPKHAFQSQSLSTPGKNWSHCACIT